MRTEEVSFQGRIPVDGYGPGGFRVAGAVHLGPLLILPNGPQAWGGLADAAPILAAAAALDLVLIGMGADPAPAPPALADALSAAGLGFEAMATPPACRTYNVLLSEGRRVAVALLPV